MIEYDHLSIDGRMSGDAWWAGQAKVVPNDNHFAYQLRLLSSAVGLVLGRVTYESFARTWPTMTGEVADKINSLPKRVASTTLTGTTWNISPFVAGSGESLLSGIRTTAMDLTKVTELGNGAVVPTCVPSR
ncbi:hypothetical protein [Nonomuraea sp. GTA35]|uniref:hypothetical protein n=1 Tax=Nonomuraea sp. GTA35 TaxID=1676746 RepID=UPI0035BF14A8